MNENLNFLFLFVFYEMNEKWFYIYWKFLILILNVFKLMFFCKWLRIENFE